ncbi:hypothetical protein INS49_015379 [Diaporthe citri]|uniref:uncharacterized protein n=1 Tax=Diaporthe citri TaxID=83186 RepID=UPI001C81DAE4|nr:uncharacterized protein INS49_015379 [Diaporthe citri]KAG6355994.1 hypothetical protein INS49_015379 [Diaporthe citri]
MAENMLLGASFAEFDMPPQIPPSVYPSNLPPKHYKDDLIPLKTWRHHGIWAAFTFAYRTNSCKYRDDSSHRHRDFANRVETLPRHDAHVNPRTGELCPLIVQCTDDVYEEAHGVTTWCRTYVRKPSPFYVRLAIWTSGSTQDSKSWTTWRVQVVIGLTGVKCFGGLYSSKLYYGKYPPVPHKYWGVARLWSNLLENPRELSQLAGSTSQYRSLKPRNLCLLTSDLWEPIDVAQWESEPANSARTLSYVFVAYSSEHFYHDTNQDMIDLHEIGMFAARKAGVAAFWVAGSCMRDENEIENDVYRISDILRGAKKMIIAVGPSKYSYDPRSTSDPLQQWGSRMWTLPEVLLSPGQEITVYSRGGDLNEPEIIPKNQVASRMWGSDADISRELIDHYLGTINLSTIELSVLTLRCLYARHTTEYLRGDHAYVLMGLLRVRPPIDKMDSQFQAFARLSLANHSDKLLERYICTLPRQPNQPWWDITDAYGSQLWDIDPVCQVAAICDHDTVVLDGARGATIEWSRFDCIWHATGPSWKRVIASFLVRLGWTFLASGILLSYLGLDSLIRFEGPKYRYDKVGSEVKLPYYCHVGFGVFFLLIWFATALANPLLVRIMLAGKIQDIQGAFYGVEGYLNPATVECLIFGFNFGRFKWSIHGSLLSQSQINEHKERVGVDPCGFADTKQKVEAAKKAKPGDMRIFTLVDTYNLEVTIFEAARPPNVLLFCGSEGGKQRAVGCSYDWTTQTFYRETVLRVPTESLERASRVSRFRMGIQRPKWETVPGK